MSTNCTDYNEMKYYIAFKKERSNKWKVQPQSFLLHYTATHLMGQFITTMWYNQLIVDSEPLQYAILEVNKDATAADKHSILKRLNRGDMMNVIRVSYKFCRKCLYHILLKYNKYIHIYIYI